MVYLGQLGESHYVPVDVKTPEGSQTSVFYTEARQKFIKWAIYLENLKISIYKTRLAEYEAKKAEEEEAVKSGNNSEDEFVNVEDDNSVKEDVLVNFSTNNDETSPTATEA